MRTLSDIGRTAALLALAGTLLVAATPSAAQRTEERCRPRALSAAYTAAVDRALRAKRDVWGEALLRSPTGPTYDGVRRHLKPLLLAGHPPGRRNDPLIASGVYYLALGQPAGPGGSASTALHVADGSQILSHRVGGRSLSLDVGPRSGERYGSCLSRLSGPRLAGGYLPILETRYVDSVGARYAQESFVSRDRQAGQLVSLVRLTVDARAARAPVRIDFTPSTTKRAALTYAVPRGAVRTIHIARINSPSASRPRAVDQTAYEAARRSSIAYWRQRLTGGATFVVPEQRVLDAERNLVIQNLTLSWRYSLGNPYEEFEFPENVDAAEVMGSYGYGPVERQILSTGLRRRPPYYPNWVMGEELLASALYHRLYADDAYLSEVTPTLARFMRTLGRQITRNPRGLLGKERYASDLPDLAYGLDAQAVVWQGLREMSQVWATTGRPALAARSGALAARLGKGLHAAVRQSQRRLPDGSLFVPVKLLEHELPYDALTATKAGSYWNLVMPSALATGLFPPGGRDAAAVLRYLQNHGSWLLGLVRAGVYALYGEPAYPTSGSDQVYGLNLARFLADNHEADQLVLMLYGALGAAMTPETFVSGEGATIAPIRGEYYRKMYLPPNSVANASFLETLRLMLVHETSGPDGIPRGLELAYSTPRGWLQPGKRIAVERAPTSFGPLTYSIATGRRAIHVSVGVPDRVPPASLRLRLRLPAGRHITGVLLDGRPYRRFSRATGTVDLSGLRGGLELTVASR